MARRVPLLLLTTLLTAVAAVIAGPVLAAAVLAPGEPLSRGLVEAVLLDALRDGGEGGRFRLSLDSPALPLANRLGVPAELSAERVQLDPRSGRLDALLVVSVAGEPRFRIAARGRAVELVEIPVLARPLQAGEIVGAADVTWATVPAAQLAARGGIGDPDTLIGAEARRRLASGRLVRDGDVGPPRLVRRGRSVTMTYERGGLRISALGQALDDGALGELVRVVNADSRRQVQGVVTGPDRVTLGPAAVAAAGR